MTRIVVGLDGSEHAHAGLGWAVELARAAPEPELHLVHAFHVALPTLEGEVYEFPHLVERARNEGQTLLDEAAGRVQAAGLPVKTHLLQGAPASDLLAVAQNVQAELIAVGSRGLSRAASFFLGSVSTEVVHRAHVPVLVVRHGAPHPVRRVLVGVDGSPHSAAALAFAARWAPQAEIVTLHVLHVSPEVQQFFAQTDVSFDVAVDRTAREVAEQTARLAAVPEGRITSRGAAGNAAEQLMVEYRTGDYDLAVVGSRGLGTLGELFLGSVSERLLRLSSGPVVVVKRP